VQVVVDASDCCGESNSSTITADVVDVTPPRVTCSVESPCSGRRITT
jgi:hypothetical protein